MNQATVNDEDLVAVRPHRGPSERQLLSDPDLLIEGGLVLTLADDGPPIENGSLAIAGNRITQLVSGRLPADKTVERINASGCLVMPGLVNAHGHTAMTLFRGYADDLPLNDWLFKKIFPAEARILNPDTVYWGALLGCVEMLRSGTTTVSDGYFYQDATATAIRDAGLRALVAQGVIDFPAPGVPDPRENLKAGQAFIERWTGVCDRIQPGLFCHSPVTCSAATLTGAMAIAAAAGAPLQLHLSETAGEVQEIIERTGRRPALYLDELGLLTERLVAVHGVHLDDAELTRIARRRTAVVHCPESNMKLAAGIARLSRMAALGIPLGLGTDGAASNNDLDLFREMDTAAKLDKIATGNPASLDAATVLRMATRGGAAALGLGTEIGVLAPGRKADIIVIDLRRPHLTPLYDPRAALVYAAAGADVRDVIVNGRILMRDRRLPHLDEQQIMARVREIAAGIQ